MADRASLQALDVDQALYDNTNNALKVNVVAGGAGGGPVTIADGADVTQGAKADTTWSGTGSGSVVAILKAVYGAIVAAVTSVSSGDAAVTVTPTVGNVVVSLTGKTGTGTTTVLSTSPTIITPAISSIVNTGTLTLPTLTGQLGYQTTYTVKNGSQNGTDYSTTLATYVDVDATNLGATITIPTGRFLLVTCVGPAYSVTGAGGGALRLVDGSTTVAEGGALTSTTQTNLFNLHCVITGDGASHTIKLQFATFNTNDAFKISNQAPSSTTTPNNGWCSILFILT